MTISREVDTFGIWEVCVEARGRITSLILGWAMLAWLILSPHSQAQLTMGTISGTITDSTGAVIPGVAIAARNTATGISRTTQAGSAGRYELPNMPLGNYEVSASTQGFQTSVRSGIELTAGRHAVVDFSLQVGEVTQSVTVTGEVPLLETTTATVSSLVGEQEIQELPLNNRDLTQLVLIQPGVLTVPRADEGNYFRSGMGNVFSVAGARGNHNLYLLDGVTNSDVSGNAQGATQSFVGAETVKEFQVITNNYSAEYKSAAGGIVSAVTKSGTNTFHGSLFEALRTDKLDAYRWEDKRIGQDPKKPELRRNQFGGSLGGPVIRDRTFFFARYEGWRETQERSDTARAPTAATRAGTLPSGFVGVNALVRPYLELYPIPGQGNTIGQNFNDGSVEIGGLAERPVSGDSVTIRMDHQLGSEKAGSLSGTFNYDESERLPLTLLGELNSTNGILNHKRIVSVGHTSVLTASMVSEFKFGFSRVQVDGEIPQDGGKDWGSLIFVPGTGKKRLGSLGVTGFTGIGYSGGGEKILQQTTLVKENLSWLRGNHSFRIGGELNRLHYPVDACTSGCYGNYSFSSIERFLGNRPRVFTVNLPEAQSIPLTWNQRSFGTYFQDNYKPFNSLTLNLGVRYEFVTVPTEEEGRSAGLRNFFDRAVTVGPLFTNPSLRSFSPRFGFAWAAQQSTSVRGGFGIFYDHITLYNIRTYITQMEPFSKTGSYTDTTESLLRFPDAFTTQANLLASSTDLRQAEYNQVPTYIYRWSLTVQQQFPGGWVGSAGYTGSRGLHLWAHYTPNVNKWLGWPNQPTGPKFWPATNSPDFGGRLNPAFSTGVRYNMSNGNSYYHGLETSLQKQLGGGLQLQLAYTFSKTMDQSADATNAEFSEGQRTMYAWDTNLLKSLSSQHIPNTFKSNFIYDIPAGRNLTGLAAALAKGWQLSGIITLADGAPRSITGGSTENSNRMGSASGLRADLIPDGNNNPTSGTSIGCTQGSGANTRIVAAGAELGTPDYYYDVCQFTPARPGFYGTLGRNTVIMPGTANIDFSLGKDFDLREGQRIQFRTEFFNALNHPSYGEPGVSPFDNQGRPNLASAVITNTKSGPRQVQIGLKFVF
jgi:hypothetical protein